MQNPVRVNSRDGCPLCFAPKTSWWGVPCAGVPLVDTIQDFLYDISMKAAMHLVEIIVFIIISSDLPKLLRASSKIAKIPIFKVNFQC